MSSDVNNEMGNAATNNVQADAAVSADLGTEGHNAVGMPICADEIAQRRQRFPAEPMLAFQTRMQGRAVLAKNVHDYIGRWNEFEEWCHLRELPVLPASEETVLRFVADQVHRLGGRKGQRDATLPPLTLQRDLTAVARVHRYLSYPDPCAWARTHLQEHARAGLLTCLMGPEELQQYLSAPAHSLVEKRAHCIVALIYALHLKATDVVTLRVEDYRPGTLECLPALRLRSSMAHRREYWQPLSRSVARIVDAWIEAVGLTSGYLICDTRRNHLGNPMCPQFVGWTLRNARPGGRPTCVRALHRRLFDDVFNGNSVELTGMQPCLQRGARAIRFGTHHPWRARRIVCERSVAHDRA